MLYSSQTKGKENPEHQKGYDMKYSTVILYGEEQNFQVCVNLMDDEIRESVHADLAPCTDQEFIDEYVKRHEAKYGEEFQVC